MSESIRVTNLHLHVHFEIHGAEFIVPGAVMTGRQRSFFEIKAI